MPGDHSLAAVYWGEFRRPPRAVQIRPTPCVGQFARNGRPPVYPRGVPVPARPPRRRRTLFSLWFDQIADQRYGRHGYWLPKGLEFRRHAGETVLGLSEGLGTDWLEYARHGTHVLACSPSQEQLALVRRNFELRPAGPLPARAPQALPVDENSIDVVCLAGLLHEVDDPAAVVAEVYRVLRPGGKVIAVVPAKYSAAFWFDTCYPWRRWLRSTPSDAGQRARTARNLQRIFRV